MRQLFLAIALTFAGFSATAENVNLMTYNLRTNDLFGLGFQSSRIDRLGQLVKESGADIVAVQEVKGSSNFNSLKVASGLEGSWYDIAGDGYGIGLLWKSTLGTPQITNVKVNPISGSTDSESRAFIIGEFTDFCFISAHFSLDAVDRDTMAARIIRYANTANKTVFVAGDFNALPNYRALITMQNNNFIILNDLSVNTFPSDKPASLIDMILGFRKNETNKQYSVVARGIPIPPSGITLSDISDHLPYNVTVNIETTISDGLVVTSNSDDITKPGTLAWCINQAQADDVIHFNVKATELLLSSVISKSLKIDGLNQFNGQRIILKKIAANKFADLSGITITLKNMILDGENTISAIGITADNSSTLNIENCVLKNINSSGAANNGGACRIQGIANINNSLFENNTQGSGTYGGGAICIYNSATVTIDNTSFIGNTALAGGAIMVNGTVTSGYTLNATNCTFANNEASLGTTNRRGGAVYLQGPTATESNATFINCTFTGNEAVNNGGALCVFASSGKKINVNLINSIFAHNISGGNKYSDIDVWNLNERVFFPTTINCIYNALLGTASEIHWTNSIIPTVLSEANIFFALEDWKDNLKRPVINEAFGQKAIFLSSLSIANNAGTATINGFSIPTVDQFGIARPLIPAIGAVEYRLSSGVDNTVSTRNVQITIKEKLLTFTGLNAKTEMSVYSLTGILLFKKMVDNQTVVALENLNTNFLIIKVKNYSFKILLK
jgi:endonuclease/exonuclease/phosphatase family metal-dependent hydrolase